MTYDRLYAGGLHLIGPVAPAAVAAGGAPMQLYFQFTTADPVGGAELSCCQLNDSQCCTIDALVATTTGIPAGAAIGTHAVTFTRTSGTGFAVDGTVTITAFDDPFVDGAGSVAGSVLANEAGRTVTGTFDGAFCAAFLSATI